MEKSPWSGDRVLVYTEEGYTHTGLYEGEIAGEWFDKFNDSGYITRWCRDRNRASRKGEINEK